MTERVRFDSGDSWCAGWHLRGQGADFHRAAGRPCVVMAHGFGGTVDTGLMGYARGFAAAGLDVLLFDYRGFGASGGSVRQRVAVRDQCDDYRSAVRAARRLDGVDPERIVLWGTSYSGGHVLRVAADDQRVVALIALTPAVDGLAVLRGLARRDSALLARLVGHGVLDAARALLRRRPHHLPVVGPPGSTAVITAPGALAGYTALAGPSWRNEVCARTVLEVGLNRPVRAVRHVRQPLLVQVGSRDAVVPTRAASRAARRAGGYAELRSYDVDHFDVYDGPWHEHVLGAQLEFLHRQPALRRAVSPEASPVVRVSAQAARVQTTPKSSVSVPSGL